jgi:hypothetical protein
LSSVAASDKSPRLTPEEDATALKIREDGCMWDDIHSTFPHRTKETIQVRYSMKLKKEYG